MRGRSRRPDGLSLLGHSPGVAFQPVLGHWVLAVFCRVVHADLGSEGLALYAPLRRCGKDYSADIDFFGVVFDFFQVLTFARR